MDKTTVFFYLWCVYVFAYLIAYLAYSAAFYLWFLLVIRK